MEIDTAYLKEELRKQTNEHRYLHSLGVAETGKRLAAIFNADENKVEIAGILHDFTKSWSKTQMADYINKYKDLSKDLLEYGEELWHGPVASIVVQERFNIKDKEIINAIRYHTSGRENMSIIEKIVCLADYIEPMREYKGIDTIRGLADKDIDRALVTALDGTLQFLIKNKRKIYPLTIKARNNLLDIIKNKSKGGKEWDYL